MIRKSLLLCTACLLMLSLMVYAQDFPAFTQEVVQDPQGVMEPSQVKQLSQILQSLPDKFKVVIVAQTGELSTTEYALQLFSHFQMAADQLLVVFNRDKEELGVHGGGYFAQRGVSNEWIARRVQETYTPHSKQQSFMTGIATFLQQISTDVSTGVNIPVEGKTSAAPRPEENQGTSLPTSVLILFTIIVLLLGIGIYAYYHRRKLFKEMDEIEDWIDAIEGKMKSLKTGHPATKKGISERTVDPLIDKIRKELLIAAETFLIESEGLCDRFRFGKAAVGLQRARDLLTQMESEIGMIQGKLFQAKVAQEECEKLAAETQKTFAIVERKLDEARLQYGTSLHELKEKLKEVEQQTAGILAVSESDAPQVLKQLTATRQALVEMMKQIDRYPYLKEELSVKLVGEIQALQEGLKQMLDQGYHLPIEQYMSMLEDMLDRSRDLYRQLEEGRVEGIEEEINAIAEQIESIYDQAEEIVTKKNLVCHYLKEFPKLLNSLEEEQQQLEIELKQLSIRYQIHQGEIFTYFIQLQKLCQEMNDQLYITRHMDSGNDLEFTHSADTLSSLEQSAQSLLELRESAYTELEELRRGELEAQEAVVSLQAEIIRLEQEVRRENLPDIPSSLHEMIAEGKKTLFSIELALNQIPLDLQRVNSLVKDAKQFHTQLLEKAELIFYHCRKAEEKIQQMNRYRNYRKGVAELLSKAEEAFRSLDFERAHLLAKQAEEVATSYSDYGQPLAKKRKKA
jgi:septation ring formation regulator